MTFEPVVAEGVDINIELTATHVFICAPVGGKEVKFKLDPVSATMIGAAITETARALINRLVQTAE